MQSQNNKILANVMKCHKNISKLNAQLYSLKKLIKTHNFNIQKNTDMIKSKTSDPIVIINDETSVEIILNAEDPKQQQVIDIKQTARKLISRFYYHIEQKMKQDSINQIQALQQFCDKEQSNDLFNKLHKGFFKLYFEQDQKCKECRQFIKDQQNYLNHIIYEHLADLKIYICIKCKLSFSKGDLLEQHIQQQHSQKQFIQEDSQSNIKQQQQQVKISSKINQFKPNFHQKLDLNNIVENIQPEKTLKKIVKPEQNDNNNFQRSSQDELKECGSLQIYIPADLNVDNEEKKNQEKQDLPSNTTKKPSKLKIKFIQVQKNDNIQNK